MQTTEINYIEKLIQIIDNIRKIYGVYPYELGISNMIFNELERVSKFVSNVRLDKKTLTIKGIKIIVDEIRNDNRVFAIANVNGRTIRTVQSLIN